MGHGNRWKAISGGAGARKMIDEALPLIHARGQVIHGASRQFMFPQTGPVTGGSVGILLRAGPIGLMSISIPEFGRKNLVLITAFPFPLEGVRHRVRITSVNEVCCGAECEIAADIANGHQVRFFATDHFVNFAAYCVGAIVDVELSGLIYRAHFREPDDLFLSNGKVLRDAGIDIDADEPIRHVIKDAAMLLPMNGWEPFDYSFQAQIKTTNTMQTGAQTFHRFHATVLRSADVDIDVMLTSALDVLEGPVPLAPKVMTGSVCIMGKLAGYAWPA